MSDMIFKLERIKSGAFICDREHTVTLKSPWAEVAKFFEPSDRAVFVNGRRTRTGVRLSHRVKDRGW